ncbi:(2E,6E)-farnesyl diphosphate synthase [Acidihalobacter ferrooxydans]|uniref:(2E,6E)-farnesyl diphosphate synthase n=1 Tax=Acidihalobacter ferrooxydans TaxID=1765967 RepID=A0A1P8UJ89_9GAMM|nr:farnesyl diphosphate synthase [Acidihalobacter ferrooxydans]APZ43898.1 (2E,6E)-farnesyl diphosphate synthase [Acidihalobacter ferrooxydans]
MSDVLQLAEHWRERVEKTLERWLPDSDTQPRQLHAAMRYATLGGGKRIRPLLVYATGRALGLDETCLDAPAAAVEIIHAYSLIHDDLPAMDDDDLRRGRPSCHKAFDEATAILAGDAMQALAFHILANDTAPNISPATRLAMIDTLAIASGSRGMAGGQAIDLEAVGRELSLAELENMHIHKTGALIRASVRIAALSAEQTDDAARERLNHYAACIGLAFQIRDDILDIEGDTEVIGKTQGADLARNKPTFPGLLGMDAAKTHAHSLHEEALRALDTFADDRTDALRWIADFIVNRIH